MSAQGDIEGLGFVRWRPLSRDNVRDAVSCRAVSPRALAKKEAVGTTPPPAPWLAGRSRTCGEGLRDGRPLEMLLLRLTMLCETCD